jgi:hypothetical protein
MCIQLDRDLESVPQNLQNCKVTDHESHVVSDFRVIVAIQLQCLLSSNHLMVHHYCSFKNIGSKLCALRNAEYS